MLPKLRSQHSIQCRKTNWSKLSLRSEVYFQRRIWSFHFFIQGCQVCPCFSFKDHDVLRLRRGFCFVPVRQAAQRLNIVNQRYPIRKETKCYQLTVCQVRRPSNYSGYLPYDVRWRVLPLTAAAPSSVIIPSSQVSRLALTLALCGHRYSQGSSMIPVLVLHEDQVKIRKDF